MVLLHCILNIHFQHRCVLLLFRHMFLCNQGMCKHILECVLLMLCDTLLLLCFFDVFGIAYHIPCIFLHCYVSLLYEKCLEIVHHMLGKFLHMESYSHSFHNQSYALLHHLLSLVFHNICNYHQRTYVKNMQSSFRQLQVTAPQLELAL